ncbi:MAG: uncharacterized protein JWQ37_805 [Blastococcus sp.]|nr:uncharacterized protein [Blastococcus sp.]
MAREIPEVVRAAAGLAATVLDEARKLPETLPGLPVRLIGLAMQKAMKVQQQYASFVARGDELFTGLRGEDEPGMATFDDDEPLPSSTGFRESAFDRAGDTEPTSASADLIVDEEMIVLAEDPAADAVVDAAVDELAAEELGEQVEGAQQSIEVLVEEAPDTEEILDEIAIDELIDQAPTLEETAPPAPKPAKSAKGRKAAKSAAKADEDAAVTEDAAAVETPLLEATPAAPGTADSPVPDSATAAGTVDAEPTADVATTVDVLTPAGEVAAVEARVTDEGVAAPETPDDAEPAPTAETPVTENDAVTATDESGAPVAATGVRTDVGDTDTTADDEAIAAGAAVDAVGETSGAATDEPAGDSDLAGSQAAGAAPIDGYDSFSIAQLRGRLRGYALSTVQDLISYEEATRARQPYLTMLRNRLEKLEQQAVESSPLAPRGA